MPGLLAVPLSEIKSCCVTVFLHKNDERTTVWDIASKKACFLFGANWTCLSQARGGVLAPRPPFPWLRASLMGLKPFVMPLKTLLVI